MSLPSFVNEPIGDPLVYDGLYVAHLSPIWEKGDVATQKYFEESLPSFSSSSSFSFSSYFVDFSFDSSSFFSWHLSPHLRALSLLHLLFASFAYLLSYEMCSSAFDKLLRALNYYFLERSCLDLKQAFLGK